MLALISLFIAGAYVGWNIGANDAANCIGTSVGSGLLSYKRAIALLSVFVVLGALLQGEQVMETVGKGIVATEIPTFGVLAALLSAGLFVTLATFFRLPVSTSQAVVGGVAGVGLAAGANVDFSLILNIVEVWIVCPFLTALISVLLYKSSAFLLRRVAEPELGDRILKALLISSACYVSFSLGANNLGNSVGPIASLGIPYVWLALLGGVSLALGAMTFGQRVAQTVGSNIIQLDPLGAACAQASAALAIHFFSIFGVPVSTSQAVVGAVVGIGLIESARTIKGRMLAEIGIGWVATPTTAGLLAFVMYYVIRIAN